MNDEVSRQQVSAARLRLEAASVRRVELLAKLARSRPASTASVRWLRKLSLALGACACGALGLIAVQRPPQPDIPALYWTRPEDPHDRRDQLVSELAQETEKLRAVRASAEPAPRPIPTDAYPSFGAVRRALGDQPESVLAWAQIGVAACTVRQEDVARTAYANVLAHSLGSRPSDGGMRPGISAALRELDERCRPRGIHLLVPQQP